MATIRCTSYHPHKKRVSLQCARLQFSSYGTPAIPTTSGRRGAFDRHPGVRRSAGSRSAATAAPSKTQDEASAGTAAIVARQKWFHAFSLFPLPKLFLGGGARLTSTSTTSKFRSLADSTAKACLRLSNSICYVSDQNSDAVMDRGWTRRHSGTKLNHSKTVR